MGASQGSEGNTLDRVKSDGKTRCRGRDDSVLHDERGRRKVAGFKNNYKELVTQFIKKGHNM